MKAFAITQKLPLEHPELFSEVEVPVPVPGPRDILVRVKAVSANPVDYKVRQRFDASKAPQILGWDASGIVESVGADVTLFKAGDAVYYAGDITRAGSNAELQLVDERIAARKPSSLRFHEAAALPLTAITAWEALFDRLRIPCRDTEASRGKTLLILGGAGGVGSIAIQLAKELTGLTIIASASRPQSADWCREMGAHHIVNHSGDWPSELRAAGFETVDYIACFNDTAQHWESMARAIKPQGAICSIVEPATPLDLNALKSKSASFAWEFMFTRSMFQTPDMIEQHRLLVQLALLVDQGKVRTTLGEKAEPLSAGSLARAHRQLESGRTIGKIVLTLEER